MIPVTDAISIDEDELGEKFVRASGPGGQHVNTSSSAVELRFDARNSPNLPDDVKHRLERVAGSRMNLEGVIVIFAQSHRSQEMNRQDARARLLDLIEQATHKPKPRKKTRPTLASKLRRLEGKTKRSGVKAMRGRPKGDD
ncbi:alternative ribosome rescue aminoacyl-tRNA hydrolase ArfB [Phenylobacterium sp.]|uniref:alternative ribosome rescue aminoacyl-tRNA hydrolase ArfB n=1 Tax=Phenylobacterium sp. TaxID=1871053 RepID=UPI0039837A93